MVEITYLMGGDTGGFYTEAKSYFLQETPLAKGNVVVDAPAGGQTLEGVFDDLRTRVAATPSAVFETINLVSHATALSSVMFGLRKSDKGAITVHSDLTNALAAVTSTTPWFKPPGAPAVTDKTHVRIYGCDIGRDTQFLKDLGTLFGAPADIAAPIRVAMFGHTGSTYWHRLARTWSVTWPNNIAATRPVPKAASDAFVAKAVSKFGPQADLRAASPLDDEGARTKKMLEDAVVAAKGGKDGFWLHEEVDVAIPASAAADPQAYVNTVPEMKSAVVAPGLPVDDTNVALTVRASDVTDKSDPKVWVAHIAMLGQKIDTPVVIADPMYNVVHIAPSATPSPGPKPVPTADGGAAPALTPSPGVWAQVSEEFLAAGGAQSALDDLVAGLSSTPAATLDEPDIALPPDLGAEDVEGEVPA